VGTLAFDSSLYHYVWIRVAVCGFKGDVFFDCNGLIRCDYYHGDYQVGPPSVATW